MSSIDRLSIRGVRSFGDTKAQTIAFHTPLTLIVGANGSGKTTIIECLKYATTGDLPPNSRLGGAFIHDPTLVNEKEVMAEVKMRFRSCDGTVMTAGRRLQLVVKKSTRSMTQLEGSLKMVRHGETITLSSRVADLNAVLPNYLGVSRAILDSVIFCHQEESLWPLSTPKELKERFDAIFEAVKYTKAIDNIKAMQKTHKANLEVMKKEEEHAKANKERGKKIEKQAHKLSAEIDDLRLQHKDLDERMQQAAENAEAAWKKAETAGLIVGELTGKRIEERTKEESVKVLRENLKEMSETDDYLQRMLEQYDERVQEYEEDLSQSKERYVDNSQDIQQARAQVSTKEREVGSYEAQAQQYERQVENRGALVKKLARSNNIRGYDSEISEEDVSVFIDRVERMAREQNAELERIRREAREELQHDQEVLAKHNQQKTSINSRKESARELIVSNDRKINALQSDLNRLNVDEGVKAGLESSLQETQSRLEIAKTDAISSGWEKQAEFTEAKLRTLDDRKEKLDAELVEGTRHAQEIARLGLVQKDIKDRQKRLDTNLGAYGDKIAAHIGDKWTPANVETVFQQAVDRSKEQLAEAERQRDGISREQGQLDFQLSTLRRELKDKQQMVQQAAAAINKKCGCQPYEFNTKLQELEESRNTMRTDEESLGRLFAYFDACIKLAKGQGGTGKHAGCRTCGRGFANEKEASRLIKLVTEERTNLERAMSENEGELKEIEQELEVAKATCSDFETWERLKEKELPAAQRNEAELVRRREAVIAELEHQDNAVSERQAEKQDVEAVARTVQTISKLYSEIEDFKSTVQDLIAKQKSAGLSRGLEQIHDDLKKLSDETRSTRAGLAKVNADRERGRGLVNSLELEVRDIRSKLSDTEHQLKEKSRLEGQIDDLKRASTEQRDQINALDKELQKLGPLIDQAQVKFDETNRRGAERDRTLQAATTKLNDSASQLRIASAEINSYIERGGPAQLERGKAEVERAKKEIKRLEDVQGQIVRTVKQLEEQLRDHAETRRSISDNQRYRRDLRQLNQVRVEIAELETHNAEADKARYQNEGDRWQRERQKLAAEQASVSGSLGSKDEALQSIIADYESEYKNAARKYKEVHILVETTKACVEDLGRFGGALDKAIMRYHSLKMEEINRIVEELWRKTYQGTDVDYIMIKSEHENVKSNKSYNYRVVMVKQGVEMDMRGRCSAGQKVLASIIVRLALAECFGVNCGLIALDEPTTNLDRDNIKALADSLSDIIKLRRQQKNFQLIVITHDEDFLKQMECSDFADVYYRVARDNEQRSVIEQQSIAEVSVPFIVISILDADRAV